MEKLKKEVKGIPMWLIVLALSAIITTAGAASYWIWSNTVTAVMGYINHLYQPSDITFGQNITFEGYVTYANGTPINGITVKLYFDNGTEVKGATIGTTNDNGNYTIQWNATAPGNYTFRTYANVIP